MPLIITELSLNVKVIYFYSLSITLSLLLCSPPVFGGVDWEVGRDGWGNERDNWGRGRDGEGEPEPDPDPDPDPTTKKVISGVPEYFQPVPNYCAPTAGGMLIGFWDTQPGFENLWYWDISTYNDYTKDMIASTEHINQTPHDNNCIADFMNTTPDDGTPVVDIPSGLRNFAAWNNPNTPTFDESCDFTSWNTYVSYYSGDFTFEKFKEEIDNGRPMLLALGHPTLDGHAVTAYGYDTFDDEIDCFAVWDTWGTNQIPGLDPVNAWTDADGVEWWAWDEWNSNSVDWSVAAGTYFNPVGYGAAGSSMGSSSAHTPEPKSFLLIGIGLLIVIGWHKKHHGRKIA